MAHIEHHHIAGHLCVCVAPSFLDSPKGRVSVSYFLVFSLKLAVTLCYSVTLQCHNIEEYQRFVF